MRKRVGVLKTLFGLFWVAGMGCITAILLGSEDSSYQHYLKLYGVGVLWLVFLLFVFGDNRVSRWNVVPKRFDKAIILLVLAGIFAALLVETLRLIVELQILPAVLLGGMCVGLFNVMRDLLRARI